MAKRRTPPFPPGGGAYVLLDVRTSGMVAGKPRRFHGRPSRRAMNGRSSGGVNTSRHRMRLNQVAQLECLCRLHWRPCLRPDHRRDPDRGLHVFNVVGTGVFCRRGGRDFSGGLCHRKEPGHTLCQQRVGATGEFSGAGVGSGCHPCPRERYPHLPVFLPSGVDEWHLLCRRRRDAGRVNVPPQPFPQPHPHNARFLAFILDSLPATCYFSST